MPYGRTLGRYFRRRREPKRRRKSPHRASRTLCALVPTTLLPLEARVETRENQPRSERPCPTSQQARPAWEEREKASSRVEKPTVTHHRGTLGFSRLLNPAQERGKGDQRDPLLPQPPEGPAGAHPSQEHDQRPPEEPQEGVDGGLEEEPQPQQEEQEEEGLGEEVPRHHPGPHPPPLGGGFGHHVHQHGAGEEGAGEAHEEAHGELEEGVHPLPTHLSLYSQELQRLRVAVGRASLSPLQ